MLETTIDANKVKTLLDIWAVHHRPTDQIVVNVATKCQVTNRHLTSQQVSLSLADARHLIYEIESAIKSYKSI